jgi:hypothetical protein
MMPGQAQLVVYAGVAAVLVGAATRGEEVVAR